MRRFFLFFLFAAAAAFAQPQILLPRSGLTADELGLIVNDDDPLSRQIGEYYRQARRIPEGNVIRVRFAPGRAALPREEFERLRREIVRAAPAHVQAWAVAWAAPYRAGCMSLTSALAFGFDERFCSRQCGATAPSPYFNSPSLYPWTELKLRPAMLLAAEDFEKARALIDRGVASDGRFPAGRAYLLQTPDRARSVRAATFEQTARELAGVFPIEVLESTGIADRDDVLFYFTGLAQVAALGTLTFLPGALADHLTSFGGQLTDSRQMSSLRWLEAGATASYGTVVEPCNHPQKFPLPALAMFFYAAGATAIEAYWKSVAWPGEGVFIGEPLARPFAPTLKAVRPGLYELRLHSPREGALRMTRADSPMGPYRPLPQVQPIRRGANRLRLALPESDKGYFRLQW